MYHVRARNSLILRILKKYKFVHFVNLFNFLHLMFTHFTQVDIPPQPHGVPRIEVTFDIDVNGILNVSARDQRTGKEQRLVINSTTGLSAQAVREAVVAAENHAAQDRRRREAIEASRGLRSLAEDVIAKVNEFGDRLPAVDAEAVVHFCREDVLARVEELKTTEDVEKLRCLNEDLQKRALDLFQKAALKVS